VGICKNFRGFSIVTPLILAAALVGCNKDQAASDISGNPANGNLASVTPSSTGQRYAPAASASYNTAQYENADYDQPPVRVTEAPPPLPVYEQPPCPGPDYVWTPGYWAYGFGGYYWVPGAWVLAPYIGALWTPPWWGFANGVYLWHVGYWAPHIGFYGGIDYGCGYTGRGYYGAYWNHGHLFYNRAVTNVDPAVLHNVYNYQVAVGFHSRVSYNGGRGGITARPTRQELAVATSQRTPPVGAQVQHSRQAAANRAQFAAVNHGNPSALTATRPLATTYRAPAAPTPAVRRAEQRPVAQTPARQERPNQHGPLQATRAPENRSAAQPIQHPKPQPFPEKRVAPEQNRAFRQRQAAPVEHAPQRPAPQRPSPQVRPEARPAPRPAPQPHPEVRQQAPRGFVAHAQPQPRPEQHNVRPPQPREEHRQH